MKPTGFHSRFQQGSMLVGSWTAWEEDEGWDDCFQISWIIQEFKDRGYNKELQKGHKRPSDWAVEQPRKVKADKSKLMHMENSINFPHNDRLRADNCYSEMDLGTHWAESYENTRWVHSGGQQNTSNGGSKQGKSRDLTREHHYSSITSCGILLWYHSPCWSSLFKKGITEMEKYLERIRRLQRRRQNQTVIIKPRKRKLLKDM